MYRDFTEYYKLRRLLYISNLKISLRVSQRHHTYTVCLMFIVPRIYNSHQTVYLSLNCSLGKFELLPLNMQIYCNLENEWACIRFP